MKDLVNIQDFLVAPHEIGDWEGEEELVCDKLNDLLHYCWDRIPDDMDTDTIERMLSGIWENLRGDTVLLDCELDELRDWVSTYMGAVQDSEN